MSIDKITTLKEAVAGLVNDGDSIAIGGMLAREPMAVTLELIRQNKKDLTVICDSRVETVDFLIGAGLVRKLEAAWLWVATANAFNFRRAVEEGIPRRIEVEDYSNLAIGMRFLAGALGVPFMPVRSMIGSDIPKYNPRVKIITDPYKGESVALVPAAEPDIAFIHAQRADKMGNAQIWGIAGNDLNIARAARKVVITCEEIISTSQIRQIPNMTHIPFYCVDAVAEVPFACYPFGTTGYYWIDVPFRRFLSTISRDYDTFCNWLNEWVLGTDDYEQYLRKVGWDRLAKLREMELDNYQIPVSV